MPSDIQGIPEHSPNCEVSKALERLVQNSPSTKMHRPIIYLACPYSDPDYAIREQRFHLANDAAASLIRQGYIVYSPITMTHPIDVVLAGAERSPQSV
jgi:hypothetical protein